MSDESTTGILLFAHGSPVEEANAGVRALAAKVQEAGPFRYVRAVFLEDGRPDLPTGVAEAAQAGLPRVIVVPYFLTDGLHVRRDLPKLIAAAKEAHPGMEITVGKSLEGNAMMPGLILGIGQEALRSVRG